MKTKKKKVEVFYEGLGTCIDATIRVNNKLICAIYSFDPVHNKKTVAIINKAMRYLESDL